MKSSIIYKHEKLFSIIIYILAALFLFYEMALQVSPGVMTQELMEDFTIDVTSLGVIAAFYFYSYTFMQIPAGLLYDRFGPRKLITASIVICAAGSLFFGSTHSPAMLALGRFLMGIGSAFAFIGVLIVAARWFHPKYFALLVGIAQLLAALGAMGGSLPLAYAVDSMGWRNTINILGGCGFFLAALTALIIRDYPKDHPLHHSNHYKLGLCKSIKECLEEKQTWAIALYAFSAWAPVAIFAALWGVPYLMTRYAILKSHAALAVSMIWIGLVLISPFIGWLSDKIRRRKSLLVICSLLGLISSGLLILVKAIPYKASFILLFFVGAAAAGQILTFALVKDNVKPKITATAIGFNNMAVVIGGAIFQPIVGWIIDHFWDGKTHGSVNIYNVEAYDKALLIVPFCFLIGLIASLLLIKETYCKQKYAESSDVKS